VKNFYKRGERMKKTAILIFIIILAGFMGAYAQDSKPFTFQDFIDGKAAIEENCMECHTLAEPMKKITDRAGWEAILTKMASKGAIMSKKKRLQILEYLVAKSTFQTKCSVCHALERPLEKNKKFQGWIETVRRMAAKKPEHLTEEEIQAVSGYLTAKGAEKTLL
jgi:mono/diheme cytochrome c family protein